MSTILTSIQNILLFLKPKLDYTSQYELVGIQNSNTCMYVYFQRERSLALACFSDSFTSDTQFK